MIRFVFLILSLFAIAVSAHAADDVSAATRGVVRVVTVAMVDGEVVGFGHGSGVAVSPTRIVTNAHVIESAVRYPGNVSVGIVPSEGQKSYAARLIAVDSARDLALIELTEGRVPAAAIYTGPVEAGLEVVALGYPGNVDLAAARSAADYIIPRAPVRSDGAVSSIQSVGGVATLLHTANIARGNSGGPLVDGCGRVLGINSFMTRADEGDAGFAFAVSAREVTKFLTESRQSYQTIGTICLSQAEAAARDRAASEAETQAAATANADRAAATALDLAQRERAGAEAALTARENRIALSGLALLIAAMAGGAGWIWRRDGDTRRARGGFVAAALIALAGAGLFFTRPTLIVALPADAAETPAAELQTATLAAGGFACAIQPGRSRITVSDTRDVPLTVAADGCVNGRTQYAEGAEGRWERVLVPNKDAAVTLASLAADGSNYRVERWLLGAEAMARIRTLRAGLDVKACTADPAARERLRVQQQAIRDALVGPANERLVYGCVVKAP